jgi:hypothetical protein
VFVFVIIVALIGTSFDVRLSGASDDLCMTSYVVSMVTRLAVSWWVKEMFCWAMISKLLDLLRTVFEIIGDLVFVVEFPLAVDNDDDVVAVFAVVPVPVVATVLMVVVLIPVHANVVKIVCCIGHKFHILVKRY